MYRRGPGDQADPPVPERHQVRHGQLGGRVLVAGDERRLDALDVAVDHHDRQPAGEQLAVALRVGGGVGVQAGDEDDAADLAVQQHLDVLVLAHAARGLRAQHGRVPLLGQDRLDDLRERGEDRVVQLRHDQPDQAGAALAQAGRPFVPQHVQRGQHGLPGLRRHARAGR